MKPNADPLAPHAALLRRALALIEALDDATFRRAGAVSGWGGVGAQLRHVVDFYTCFLRGLGTGRVDYLARDRRPDLETDRMLAAGAFAAVLDALSALSAEDLTRSLEVRDEDAPGWSASSAGRELSFLLSHTVHHFALVRLLLGEARPSVGVDFGVAPSTLRYRAEHA